MSSIAIVTDTTAYLPAELIDELGLHVVSLHVDYGDGRRELESEIDFGEYYDYLVTAETLPVTAPPAVDQFLETYSALLADGHEIVSIHISSGISRTCSVAREAAERLADRGGERIHVVDSATAAVALGLVAVAGARKAAAGADVIEIVNSVREARQELKNRFTVETLEYLKRGGRIGGAAAWMGTTLKIQPILTLGAEVTAVERVRTRERAVERILDFCRGLHAGGGQAWAVQHARAPDDAAALAAGVEEIFWRPPEFISEVGPVLGTHGGPGTLAVAMIPTRFLE